MDHKLETDIDEVILNGLDEINDCSKSPISGELNS